MPGQDLTATITAQSQLTSVEDFQRILLRTGADGASVWLGDVAEIEGSHTAVYLAPLLGGVAQPKRAPARKRKAKAA